MVFSYCDIIYWENYHFSMDSCPDFIKTQLCVLCQTVLWPLLILPTYITSISAKTMNSQQPWLYIFEIKWGYSFYVIFFRSCFNYSSFFVFLYIFFIKCRLLSVAVAGARKHLRARCSRGLQATVSPGQNKVDTHIISKWL